MREGTVFSIEEFAINDGPGIRTTIFLKGCSLRCAWCHNPEGLLSDPQYISKKGKRVMCGYKISSGELAEKLLVNKEIYKLNQGGVTLTGGEPLFQPEFIIDLLDKINIEIHTAIETSGYASREVFKEVTSKCRLVMFDVKHTNTLIHQQFTGVYNEPILKNLDYLCNHDTEFILRIPLIPGVNDTRQNMLNILSMIKEVPSLMKVEILPYNKLAGAKYAMVGKEYNPPFNGEVAPHIYDVFSEQGIRVEVL